MRNISQYSWYYYTGWYRMIDVEKYTTHLEEQLFSRDRSVAT